MRKHFTCSQGHRWEVTLDGQFSGAVQCMVCPACGAAAETIWPAESAGGLSSAAEGLVPAGSKSVDTSPELVAIPGYEILGVLGQGGMGVVYKARQIRLKRLVALKMIPPGRIGFDQLDRFRLEAEAAARLQHPNIVQIYEIGEAADRPYFSLEFVDGGSLDKTLAGTPQPARTSAELLETLARAIHYAHEQGIVHRDLKPANILLASVADYGLRTTDYGLIPKITDFGLAKQLDAEVDQTQSGAVLGTPSYMAPEQARGQKHLIGPLSDVYALGAILYEMLTGRPPFRGTTTLETLEQVRAQEPVSPRRLQPGGAARLGDHLSEVPGKGVAPALPERLGLGRGLAAVSES